MKRKLLPLFILIMTSNVTFAAKESIYTKNAPEPIGIYSQAIKIDKTVYISGQIPIDPRTGNMVEGNFKDQAKQVITNIN